VGPMLTDNCRETLRILKAREKNKTKKLKEERKICLFFLWAFL
jgi:hypothetical protein